MPYSPPLRAPARCCLPIEPITIEYNIVIVMNKYTKSTRARLESAERQNRWLTVIAIAAIITLLVAAAGGPTVIRETAIEMFDENSN